ncbi:phage portal protein [Nonomuraea sp. NPDC059023]|uniref:phage portal protein n=1 Tax=unclassified Nonomuraea TaxID=2593643 RepID=UPI0036CEC9B2
MARRRFLPGLRALVQTKQWGAWAAPSGVFMPSSDAMRRAWPVERAVAEAWERTVWVYKSVDAIAGHQAKLDFQLRDGDEVITDHPLCELLNDGKANPLESGRQFRKRLSQQILLSSAGAFVEVTHSNRGTPIRYDLLPPGRTRPVPGRGADLLSHFETIAPDGRRVGIDPERVRWFRDVHPTDPYRGMTPIEAASLSVDLDFLSRLYNVVFLRNDGRPATVVGVEGKLSQPEADRIENRFGRGPMEAGKVSVINGKITVNDLAAKPRDMAYSEAASRAKEEVLAAFGVGETVMGNAAGRTYDNADAELFQFWTITMDAHMGIVTSGFHPDSDEGLIGKLDVSGVEVLRRVELARRQEAREELNVGAITVNEYRTIAEYDEFDMPHARAFYVSNTKTAVPTTEDDAIALGLASPPEDELAAPAGDEAAEGAPVEDGPEPAGPETAAEPPAEPQSGAGLGRLQQLLDGEQTKAVGVADLLPAVEPATAPVPVAADVRDDIEEQLQQVLVQLARRLVERTAGRASGTKARRGTRHWAAEYEVDTRVGDAPLPVTRIVDPDQWYEDATGALRPVVDAAESAAAAALVASFPHLADTGVAASGAVAAEGAGAATLHWLADSIKQSATLLGAKITGLDGAGADIAAITSSIRADLSLREEWAKRMAITAATDIVHAAEAAAALALAGKTGMATATWTNRDDGPMQAAHATADGQVQPAEGKFRVGDALLRWPGDTAGPPHEVNGCKCRLRWLIVPGLRT